MVAKYLIYNLILFTLFLTNTSIGKTINGKAKIIDGDTIHIDKFKIRLHAIDAPEIDQTCKKDNLVWKCGLESTIFLKKIVNNKELSCKASSKDRYNRFIAICYIDKIDLNSMMVENGWAIAYRYYSLDYIKEERIAKSKKIGIWIGKFEEPYLFRKKNK